MKNTETQQTVVDRIVNLLNKEGFAPVLTEEEIKSFKEMEKKRLMNAFNEGQEYEYQYHVNSTPKFDSETWYNETYGGNK
jgi:hypothetical protein